MSSDEVQAHADGIITFLNEAWTPFHAVAASAARLQAAGFEKLIEGEEWHIKPGGRYYFTRNMTTIIAFAIGEKYDPVASRSTSGYTIIGAHTDSPCPKLKPASKLTKSGFLSLSVVGYGGGLWHTWFDRDLTLAGRVLVRQPNGNIKAELVRINRPIIRIPNLAIHLQSDEERSGFSPNLQAHFPPVLASEIKAKLETPVNSNSKGGAVGSSSSSSTTTIPASPSFSSSAVKAAVQQGRGGSGINPTLPTSSSSQSADEASSSSPIGNLHHPLLLQLLAEEVGTSVDRIVDFELQICDVQPSTIGGALREFIFSGRLDNLASCYQAMTALIDSSKGEGSLKEEVNVRLMALFDHEEIGSMSSQGAASSLMPEILARITKTVTGNRNSNPNLNDIDILSRALRHSYIVSADMAHALHPNYEAKHDPGLQPKMHGGLVIKHNANQRYATNAITAHIFREIGSKHAKVPFQEFAVRADSRCGSTIGPLVAGLTGVRTVDVGSPQWSMHSIRETMAVTDVYHGYKHFKAVYETYPLIAAESAEVLYS